MESEIQARIRRIARQRLQSLGRAGVGELLRMGRLARTPRAAASASSVSAAGPASVSEDPHTVPPADPAPRQDQRSLLPQLGPHAESDSPLETRAQRQEALQVLAEQVAGCTRCRELAETRTQTVFGVGNPEARLVFLGEAPGADEDRLGEPFVGRAGQLLDKIIEACTLTREQVYILNILKCRPPGNRNPSATEAANCRDYLLRQLEVIRPEFICCLGTVAAQNLLETSESIGRLRGRFHDFEGIRVMATYHPAYLLRNPSAKRATWTDMKMLMREMGIPIRK